MCGQVSDRGLGGISITIPAIEIENGETAGKFFTHVLWGVRERPVFRRPREAWAWLDQGSSKSQPICRTFV